MSILVGKASRFTEASKAAGNVETPFKTRLRPGQLANSLPPRAYQQINVGPELVLQMEDAQAIPVDASNPLLRSLSPFLIQVEPPLAFANEPKKTGKGKAVGIFDAAYQGQSTNLGKSPAGQNAFLQSDEVKGGSQEILAKNAPSPQTNMSGDGNLTLSAGGATPIGKLGNPQIADLEQALDIVTQLAAIQNSPPLVLLINPSNLSMQFTRIHQFSDRSRYGYIYQAWGEDQPRLSINAKCGAFVSGGRGVQMASMQDSASWQNLMSLFRLYRSNGYLYDTLGKSNAHLFVGGLSIHYDGWIYYGNMESFNWTYDEQANQLGGVEFSMEFVCSMMIDASSQTTNVSPLRSPNPNPFSNRRRSNAFSRRQGESTLSIGLDGDVRGTIFGGGPGQQPVINPSPPNQGLGDPDFTGAVAATVQGNSAIAQGGGFQAPVETPVHSATEYATRTQPFLRGN